MTKDDTLRYVGISLGHCQPNYKYIVNQYFVYNRLHVVAQKTVINIYTHIKDITYTYMDKRISFVIKYNYLLRCIFTFI